MTRLALLAAAVALLLARPGWAQTGTEPPAGQPISIVAAENFYGEVARQLAGPEGHVTSVLSNPDQDPHLFEASPSVARELSAARIVVLNGADYDPWMEKLLRAARSPDRATIVVAQLVHRVAGDNPHLWYDPATMPAYARALAAELDAADPAHKAEHEEQLRRFLDSLRPVEAKVTELRGRFAGTPVTATEPVFGYMATALGLDMRNERFQRAVMNDTEPSASDTAAFTADLRLHRVRLFIYNSQATDSAAQRLLRIARQSKVPVIGVTETQPAGMTYQDWMLGQLDALEKALSSNPA